MQSMKKTIAAALCCCLLLLTITAQEKVPEPSLTETSEWIQKTCAVSADRQEVAFDGCSVSAFWRRPGDGLFLWFATIPLKDVKSVDMELDKSEWRVQLHTTNKFPAHMSRRNGPTQQTDQFDIAIGEKQMAERIKTAFLHAVDLCKKQKEPF